MHDPVKDATRRTLRYWYVDGLADMAAGLILILSAVYYGLLFLFGNSRPTALAIGIGQPILLVLAIWLAPRLVARLKERITYPRTGYVTYRHMERRKRIVRAISTALLAALMGFAFSLLFRRISANWIPIITGGLVALLTVWFGIRFDLARMYVLAVFTFLLGLITAYLKFPDLLSSTFFFGSLGLGWLISGGTTLYLYLRSTRPALEGEM